MKYKICVYAICKNESKFVKRWYESMKEADEIYVLDTGSNDNTVKLLNECGINVTVKKIEPWRFDVARNESLKMLPNDCDICVCTDLDEIFNKGWRNELEKVWTLNTNRLRYVYNWSLDENNKPIISFMSEKIHSLKNYKWINPVHEILKYSGKNENIESTDKLIINHYPDSTKSRGSYLSLLEISVNENPNNDRNMHYLGREYMYYGDWNKSIDTLIKHLDLESATWKDERCASMRFIARCYKNLNRFYESEMWLFKAIEEAPYLRDPYVELAILYYEKENWNNTIKYCLKALEINKHQMTYINEPFSWDHTIYDLLSIAYFNLKDYENSLKNINLAIEKNNKIQRLHDNKKIIEGRINNLK